MPSGDITPESLLGLSGGYWRTCALHAAVALDVFTLLAPGPLTTPALAQSAGCDPRALSMLLTALAAMQLIDAKDSVWSLPAQSEKLLSKTSPDYLGHIILHHHLLMASWTKLPEAVRTGRPVRMHTAQGEEGREAFLMGMFNLAMAIAPGLARSIDLTGRARLLDLGGGPGTYACQFCLANPGLQATIFDLPTSEPFAKTVSARFHVEDRVAFVAGDYLADPLPQGFDVAWLSQILHGEGPQDCLAIIKKAAGAVRPGGLVFVHEFLLDDHAPGPLFPALFSLNMLLGTPGGQSYSEGQIRDMLLEAGAGEVTRLAFRGPSDSAVLCARVD